MRWSGATEPVTAIRMSRPGHGAQSGGPVGAFPGAGRSRPKWSYTTFCASSTPRPHAPDPFIQGAVWYLGEVICRERGTVWKYEPDTTTSQAAAPLFDPADRPGVLDTPCVSLPADSPERGLYPLNVLRRMLMEKDALGNPVDERLVDALEGDYLDDDFDEEDED
jgi:hypothetical protein